MTGTEPPKPLRCHRCQSAELVLHETRHEHAEYDGGLFIDKDGRLAAHGEASFAPGEVQPALTRIECGSCGHSWRPRRSFTGVGA